MVCLEAECVAGIDDKTVVGAWKWQRIPCAHPLHGVSGWKVTSNNVS